MTESDHGRHRGGPRSNSTQRRLAVALLVVAVVGSAAATAWAVTENARDNHAAGGDAEPTVAAAAENRATEAAPTESAESETPAEEDAPGAAAPRAATSSAPTPSAELVACEEAVASADHAVRAAESGVTHWNEHVQARTDLLAGAIKLADTNEIFKRTRLAGPEDLEVFDAANKQFKNVGPACDDLDPSQVSADWMEAARACLDRQPIAAGTVDAAAATIDDWRSHQANMRAHADGDMTSTMAQQEWIVAWTNAPPNLNAYDDALEKLSNAPACAL